MGSSSSFSIAYLKFRLSLLLVSVIRNASLFQFCSLEGRTPNGITSNECLSNLYRGRHHSRPGSKNFLRLTPTNCIVIWKKSKVTRLLIILIKKYKYMTAAALNDNYHCNAYSEKVKINNASTDRNDNDN